MLYFINLVVVSSILVLSACDKKESDSASSYDFSAKAKATIKSTAMSLTGNGKSLYLAEQSSGGAKYLCENGETITCAGPSKLTGEYFSVGLLIQANGKGMQSYLLEDQWSSITTSSKTYAFDASNPTVASGALTCCGGSGDLNSDNTYFSNVNYLFSYLDVSFTIPYSDVQKTRVFDEIKAEHTVRFVLADDTKTGAKRGDLLYKDTDGTFKWVDSAGTRSATRPESPLTMDKSVVNYESPFPELKTEIPIVATEVSDDAKGKIVTSESALKDANKTYTFDFDTSYLVVIMLKSDELELIQKVEDLLPRLHLSGLPHSTFEFSTAGNSQLTIK